jgi:hypothetical protein
MSKKSFNWKTEFRSIIVVDGELYSNHYDLIAYLTPITPNLNKQNKYFDRLKSLFTIVFNNTIITSRNDDLYELLKINTKNRFIELPKPPFDQVLGAVAFSKANAILEGNIIIDAIEIGSYQGDGVFYTIESDSAELQFLDVDNWFSKKYNKFDPWWLRSDTATYDKELEKGIYTGHFSWESEKKITSKEENNHAKIFEFTPKVLDGGKGKKK